MNKATFMVNEEAVTTPIKMALEEMKYWPKVAKSLGLTRREYERVDWKAHSRMVKSLNSTATAKVVWGCTQHVH